MQALLTISSPTNPNKKKRRRRAKRKNTQQQDQKTDENTQVIEEVVQTINEPQKHNDDNPPSKSTSLSNGENTEGSLKGSGASPEKQNQKKKRKRRRRNRKSLSHNESDSGISNPSVSDYAGQNEELFASTDNLFAKLSDELPTINQAIQSFDMSKEKEIYHLTWHLEIVKKKFSKSKKSLFERYSERLNAWHCFMALLRYYISYYGNQNSKNQFKEHVKSLINEIVKTKLMFEETQSILNH